MIVDQITSKPILGTLSKESKRFFQSLEKGLTKYNIFISLKQEEKLKKNYF